jgi:NADPH:quinone reductase-like Zn-dependent oxidoreductase
MRAFAADEFGEISGLSLRDLPKPTPAPDQLLVQVRAAAVNPADLKVLRHKDGGSFLHASVFPLVLGYDFSGVVVEVGSAAGKHAVGDEVYGFLPYARGTTQGSYSEFIAVGADTAGPKPKSITHEQAAAAATSAATALQALRKGKLAAGQRVLVNGAAGGVGSYAVQIAKAMGAQVSGTASASKVAHVTALGVERVYDYKATPLAAITEKFHVVFDCASTSSFGTCAALLEPGGAYVSLLPGPGAFLGVARSWFSSKRAAFIICKSVAADLAEIGAWFDAGKLTSAVDASYPLAELPAALERFAAGDVRGKIAVTVASA